MTPLFDPVKFEFGKSSDLFPLKCEFCNKAFFKQKKEIKNYAHHLKTRGIKEGRFCSIKCFGLNNNKRKNINCENCGKNFFKRADQILKTKNSFCSRSCSATYKNTHKTKGSRISKLESYLATKLVELYPNLEFHFNRKDTINSELDIYIPSLKLAFELNGIFHYEPIYGTDKLDKTQNNDKRKFAACIEKDISLCIIDTSSQTYFKENTAKPFLAIIANIINGRIVANTPVVTGINSN